MLSVVETNAAPASAGIDPLYYAISAWENARDALDRAKRAELDARSAMAALAWPELPDGGTHYLPLKNGWRLQGVFGVNVTIDRAKLPDMLLNLAAHSKAGAAAADSIMRYKPELVSAVYKSLMPQAAAIVDSVITTTQATPAFKLIEPKSANGK